MESIKNQFFYTQEIEQAPKEGEEKGEVIKLMASFNVHKVIQAVEHKEGQLMLILDDFHKADWQPIRMAKFNGKGQPTGAYSIEYKETTQCSQIELNKEDTIRFKKTVGI